MKITKKSHCDRVDGQTKKGSLPKMLSVTHTPMDLNGRCRLFPQRRIWQTQKRRKNFVCVPIAG